MIVLISSSNFQWTSKHLGCVRFGENWISDFAIDRKRNPYIDFTFELEILPLDGLHLRNPNTDLMDFLFYRSICKAVLVNSGLFSATYACACKTAVLKNSFSNSFFGYGKKRNPRIDYLLSVETRLRTSRSIANTTSGF